ncbi:MAG: saccharopine dehydrogenase NADP-binding domain-containing protein [Chloroflexota bacterium]|nr:saccharopine dehydrogenase NADP-binding domain-containing protein [Chloroflexota bacterium]
MRVLALGGAGAMGRAALTAGAQLSAWTALTVADRDGDAARRVAAGLPHAMGTEVDATDGVALRLLMRDVDIVVSTVGPYYRFGDKVLAAAIEASCHYVDICAAASSHPRRASRRRRSSRDWRRSVPKAARAMTRPPSCGSTRTPTHHQPTRETANDARTRQRTRGPDKPAAAQAAPTRGRGCGVADVLDRGRGYRVPRCQRLRHR